MHGRRSRSQQFVKALQNCGIMPNQPELAAEVSSDEHVSDGNSLEDESFDGFQSDDDEDDSKE